MQRTFTVKEVYVMPDKPWVIYTAMDGIKYTVQKSDTIITNLLQVGKEVTVSVKDQPSQSGNWRILTVLEANGAAAPAPAPQSQVPAATPPALSREVTRNESIENQVALKVAGELCVALIASKGVTDSTAVVRTLPILYTLCQSLLNGDITVEKSKLADMMLPKVQP